MQVFSIGFFFVLLITPLNIAAPRSPPVSVKVTLIEENTALVSWKPPEDMGSSVTQYTIFYASSKDSAAGKWQNMHRDGNIPASFWADIL